MNTNLEKELQRARASAEAVVGVAVTVAVLTIGAELWSPLKDLLKAVFTHHWVGKSVLSILVFAGIFFLRFRVATDSAQLQRAVYAAVTSSFIAAFLITAFYIGHAIHLF